MINELMKELDNIYNISTTENGALGYKTTGKNLLDLHFSISSLRNASEEEIIRKFIDAFCEEPILAIKWLFYCRDIRKGIGERRTIRILFNFLFDSLFTYEVQEDLLKLIAEYGRWDDLLEIFYNNPSSEASGIIISIIQQQLLSDIENMKNKQSISLLAKWMPSINSKNKSTRTKAHQLLERMTILKGKTQDSRERGYRIIMSDFRKYLDIVETKMCQNKWNEIDYSKVPSKANLLYSRAFMKHDSDRRAQFLENVENGKEKINASVIYPHEIAHQYLGSFFNNDSARTTEALWKALPRIDMKETLVVSDGSYSMKSTIGKTSITAYEVSMALAVYFAECNKGEYHNSFMTFGSRPRILSFNDNDSLLQKLHVAVSNTDCSNTNIEAVFDIVLQTAINKQLKQSDLPENILILSDMEFDNISNSKERERRLFEVFNERYRQAGYKLPKLIFWNIMSKSKTIPIKENENGVVLVSGFSPNVVKMMMSNKTDPYEILVETLNSERYQAIEDIIKVYS